jgi:DNA-binding MarR family transcriptional regulator
MRAGFQVIPNILIQVHRQLRLDALDVLILLNINMHWWEASVLPYPKPSMIAERIGVSRRTVERRLNGMQKAGLIQRLPTEQVRGTSIKRIRLTGLVEQLSRLAEASPGLRRRLPVGGSGDGGNDAED